MKKILVIGVILFATTAFGQVDTVLKVVYANHQGHTRQIAHFLNDELVSYTLVETLNPKLIESINVVKSKIQINQVDYDGQIHIKTKNQYNPKAISLSALKEKYTNLKNKPTIFMLNGNVINADYDKYVVDENYLLTIIVDKVENSKEKIDVALIKLLTKSEENIKKSKEFIIRGTQTSAMK